MLVKYENDLRRSQHLIERNARDITEIIVVDSRRQRHRGGCPGGVAATLVGPVRTRRRKAELMRTNFAERREEDVHTGGSVIQSIAAGLYQLLSMPTIKAI
jgi:hypothetical protein